MGKRKKKMLERKDEMKGRCLQLGERLLPFFPFNFTLFSATFGGKHQRYLQFGRIRLLDSVI